MNDRSSATPIPTQEQNASRGKRSPLSLLSRVLALAGLVCFALGLGLALLHWHAGWGLAFRWAGFALALPYAVECRSLLTWTFFAMLAGAELGADAPGFATQTRFIADWKVGP